MTPARLLDGRALARARSDSTRRRIDGHRKKAGRPPHLEVVLVGDDPASGVYVRNKERAAAALGIETAIHRLGPAATQGDVAGTLSARAAHREVDGLILQLPLPHGLSARPLLESIPPGQDVDGFHPENIGRLLTGTGGGFAPATPLAITWILEDAKVDLSGAEVCIVSHSNLIGKPLAALLVNADATVTVCHKFTKDLAAHTSRADVLVTAAGVPGLISARHVRDGAVVIDAATVLGSDGVLRGDCDAEAVRAKASALTPVPGGVGPVTVAALLDNTVTAWIRRTT